jgi:hypothetical protein
VCYALWQRYPHYNKDNTAFHVIPPSLINIEASFGASAISTPHFTHIVTFTSLQLVIGSQGMTEWKPTVHKDKPNNIPFISKCLVERCWLLHELGIWFEIHQLWSKSALIWRFGMCCKTWQLVNRLVSIGCKSDLFLPKVCFGNVIPSFLFKSNLLG